MKKLKANDFLTEINGIIKSSIPDVPFQEEYAKILRAEAIYQISLLIEEGELAEEEITKIISFGILKIPNSVKLFRAKKISEGLIIHPFRFLPIKAPMMQRDIYGTITWVVQDKEKKVKEDFSLLDVLEYAYTKLNVFRKENDIAAMQWLSKAVEKYQRQQIPVITKADKLDLLLFAIDASSVLERTTTLFRISDSFKAGAELYIDKLNILHHTETV